MSSLFPDYQNFCLETLKKSNAITDSYSYFILFDKNSTHPTWFAFVKNTRPAFNDKQYWSPLINLYDSYMMVCEIVDLHFNKDTLLYQKSTIDQEGNYVTVLSLKEIITLNQLPDEGCSYFKDDLIDLVDYQTISNQLAYPPTNDENFKAKQFAHVLEMFPKGLVDLRTRCVAWGLLNQIYTEYRIAFIDAIVLPFAKGAGAFVKHYAENEQFSTINIMQQHIIRANSITIPPNQWIVLNNDSFGLSYNILDKTVNLNRGSYARIDKQYTIGLFLYAFNMCNAGHNYFCYKPKDVNMLTIWIASPIVDLLNMFYCNIQSPADDVDVEIVLFWEKNILLPHITHLQFIDLYVRTLLALTNFENEEILTQFYSIEALKNCLSVEQNNEGYCYYDIETWYCQPKTGKYIKLAYFDDVTHARSTNLIKKPPKRNYYETKSLRQQLVTSDGKIQYTVFKVLSMEAGVTQAEVMFSFVEEKLLVNISPPISREDAIEILIDHEAQIQQLFTSNFTTDISKAEITISQLEIEFEKILTNKQGLIDLAEDTQYDPNTSVVMNSTINSVSFHLNTPEIVEFLNDEPISVYSIICVAENAHFQTTISTWDNVKANRMQVAKDFNELFNSSKKIFDFFKYLFSEGAMKETILQDTMTSMETILMQCALVSIGPVNIKFDLSENNIWNRLKDNYYILSNVDNTVFFANSSFRYFYSQDDVLQCILYDQNTAVPIPDKILTDTPCMAWLFKVLIENNFEHSIYTLKDLILYFLKDLHATSYLYCNIKIENANNIYIIGTEGEYIIQYFIENQIFVPQMTDDNQNANNTVDFKKFLLDYVVDHYESFGSKMYITDHAANTYVLVKNNKLELFVYSSDDHTDVEVAVMAQMCFLSKQIGYTFVCLDESVDHFSHLAMVLTIDADTALKKILNKEVKVLHTINKALPEGVYSNNFSKCLQHILYAAGSSDTSKTTSTVVEFKKVFQEFYKIFYYHVFKDAKCLNITLEYNDVNLVNWSYLPLSKHVLIDTHIVVYLVSFEIFNKVFSLNQIHENYFDDMVYGPTTDHGGAENLQTYESGNTATSSIANLQNIQFGGGSSSSSTPVLPHLKRLKHLYLPEANTSPIIRK